MIAEIRRIGAALGVSEKGLRKIARDIAHDGTLLSLQHMRREHQEEMLGFLKQIAAKQYVEHEMFDRMLA